MVNVNERGFVMKKEVITFYDIIATTFLGFFIGIIVIALLSLCAMPANAQSYEKYKMKDGRGVTVQTVRVYKNSKGKD